MDTVAEARKVVDKSSFVYFVRTVAAQVRSNPGQFENLSAYELLEGMAAWVEDCDGYYENSGEPIPEIGNWKGVADIVGASLVYEG